MPDLSAYESVDYFFLLEMSSFWLPLYTTLTPLLTMECPRVQSSYHFYFPTIASPSEISFSITTLYSNRYLFSIFRRGLPLNSRHQPTRSLGYQTGISKSTRPKSGSCVLPCTSKPIYTFFTSQGKPWESSSFSHTNPISNPILTVNVQNTSRFDQLLSSLLSHHVLPF